MFDLTKVRPVGDLVLVRRFVQQEKTQGGILIPEVGKQTTEQRTRRAHRGVVLAVGSGYYTKTGKHFGCSVAVGSIVHFDPNQARPIKDQDSRGRFVEIGVFVRNSELLMVEDVD